MLIDSHVHLPNLKWTSVEYEDALFGEMLRWGVDLAIISSLGDWSEYPDREAVRQGNLQAAAFVRRQPERSRFLAYLNPQLPNWRSELKQSLADGAIGIKLWISLKSRNGSLNRTEAVLAAAAELNLPVLLHTYNRTDGNRPGEISVGEFASLSRQFPRLTMIAAHAGGNFRQSFGVLKEQAGGNAYWDFSGGYPEQGMVEALVRSDGAERVLFGSDFYGRSCGSQIAKLELARLTRKDYELLSWKNAVKAFKLTTLPPVLPKLAAARVKTSPLFREDHFCFCGSWPFYRTPCSPPALEAKLRQSGVRKAFVADLTGVLYLDHLESNRLWAAKCRNLSVIRPLATVDPTAYNWEIVLEEAVKTRKFAGLWMSPYMHNYRLDDPAFKDFFDRCAALKLPLWLNAAVADHRFRAGSWQPRPLALAEWQNFLAAAPPNRYVMQGLTEAFIIKGLEAETAGGFRFELSRLTDFGVGLRGFTEKYGDGRLVGGSEYPFRELSEVRLAAR